MEEDQLPFIGELLRVRDEERDWEGAAERVLHQFGLSMVVPDEHYRAVAAYVDKNNLRGRLVYFRVGAKSAPRLQESISLHPNSLVRKLAINPDSGYRAWLERQLAKRFDLACCMEQEQFVREEKAITRAGQIKTSGDRHEKDDRHAINDRSTYVLGWTNAAKIEALEAQQAILETKIARLSKAYADANNSVRDLGRKREALCGIDQYPAYSAIDWGSVAQEINELEKAVAAIERASNRLAQLNDDLKAAEKTLAEIVVKISKANEKSGAFQASINNDNGVLDEVVKLLKDIPETIVERLAGFCVEWLREFQPQDGAAPWSRPVCSFRFWGIPAAMYHSWHQRS